MTVVDVEGRHTAKSAGLKYVTDKEPGYYRLRVGKSFKYVDHRGKILKAKKILARIQALVIPPAWEDVWICKYDHGHLQCTGFDVRRRKQYRYHAEWSRTRNQTKFDKLLQFGRLLPQIRRQVKKDLQRKDFSKPKVIAAVIDIMEATRIRVGNDTYAQENEHYGLTTLLNKHVKVQGSKIHFKFHGKSGVLRDINLQSPHLSRIIKHCQELPGQELFAYEDEQGGVHDITSTDVNQYLQDITGEHITAKDFRTWGGSVKALEYLLANRPAVIGTKNILKFREVATIKSVASHLGNTVAVCRKYYVHPKIFEVDATKDLKKVHGSLKRASGLTKEETILMKILSQR